MATVLDAFALVALALDEPAAEEVEGILRSGDVRMSVVNRSEAVDQLRRVHGRDWRELREGFRTLEAEVIDLVPVDDRISWRAAEMRDRYYKRRVSELSLADCIALATAEPGDSLATADPPLAIAARSEGVEVMALPDSRGRRP